MKNELFRILLTMSLSVLSFGLLYLIRLAVRHRRKEKDDTTLENVDDFLTDKLDRNEDGEVDIKDLFDQKGS